MIEGLWHLDFEVFYLLLFVECSSKKKEKEKEKENVLH